MARVIKQIDYNTRSVTFTGRVVFASMGKYVTDFMRRFKGDENFRIIPLSEEEYAATDGRGDSFVVHVPDANRGALIEALATMPDEAFGWFVLACPVSAMTHGGRAQIWPDGMGGFSPESRASVEAMRYAADAYLGRQPR